MILRRICPGSFELNDGLFVAITDEDVAYEPTFFEACLASGIPARRVTPRGGAAPRAATSTPS